MWSEMRIKNTILLNGIYLVLSELFIQLSSSQNDRGVNASEVTTSCQYQSWSLREFNHLPFLLSQHKMRFLSFFLHFKSHVTQQNICQACKKQSMPASFSNQLSLVIHYVRFIYFCLILAPAICILPLSRLSGWLGWNSIQLLKIVEKYWKYLKRCLWIRANSSTPLAAPARPVLPQTRGNSHFFTSEILPSVNIIWKINSFSFMEAFLHESLDSVLIANLTLWLLLAFDSNLPLLKINSECICFQVCFLLSFFPSPSFQTLWTGFTGLQTHLKALPESFTLLLAANSALSTSNTCKTLDHHPLCIHLNEQTEVQILKK